jgi:hypothetical protein
MVTLHGYLCTSMITSPWILLRVRNVSDKSCIGNQNAHFFFKHVFLKIVSLWDSVENTEYIVEFSLQQWLREHTTMLCYHIAYLISFHFRMVIMIRGYRSECTMQFWYAYSPTYHKIHVYCLHFTSSLNMYLLGWLMTQMVMNSEKMNG